jgi:hypothetical protein
MTERDRELDDAQARPDVAPRARDDVDQAATHVIGQELKLLPVETLNVLRFVNAV